jgi:uncharacterized membrane protein YkoI
MKGAVALALARVLGCLLLAFADSLCGRAADTMVKLSEVSTKGQQAIQAQVGDGKLVAITRSSDGCEVRYDVEMTKGGRHRGFAVNAEGDLLETQVYMRELPQALQRAIHAHIGRGAPQSITKANEDGELSYEVEFTREGKDRDFTLDSKGELVQERMFLEELPEAVRAAVNKEAASSKCGEIYTTVDEGEIYYEAEFDMNGKTRTVGFDRKGAIAYQEETVPFTEVPPAARDAAKARLGGAIPCEVTKHTEENEVSYEIAYKKDGKLQSVTISSGGKQQ